MNLLADALSILPTVEIGWRRFWHTSKDARGQEKAWHFRPRKIRAMVQPAHADDYERYSVLANKKLWSVHASLPIKSADKMRAPDLILWDGRILEVIGIDDWHTYDGWVQATAIEVGHEKNR